MKDRDERHAAFYELLPEASRDAELRAHLMTYYQAWYDWAAGVLSPSIGDDRRPASLGQFASLLLDGLFIQMVAAAPGFDLATALDDARAALTHLAEPAGERNRSGSSARGGPTTRGVGGDPQAARSRS